MQGKREGGAEGEREMGFSPEAAIVNFYSPGDKLCGHKDDVEIERDAPVVSITLGLSAIFLVGGSSAEDWPVPLLVRSGDVMVMGGESRFVLHGVPRVFEDAGGVFEHRYCGGPSVDGPPVLSSACSFSSSSSSFSSSSSSWCGDASFSASSSSGGQRKTGGEAQERIPDPQPVVERGEEAPKENAAEKTQCVDGGGQAFSVSVSETKKRVVENAAMKEDGDPKVQLTAAGNRTDEVRSLELSTHPQAHCPLFGRTESESRPSTSMTKLASNDASSFDLNTLLSSRPELKGTTEQLQRMRVNINVRQVFPKHSVK
uniref:Alpha-ketoglutarate-dependent dioxygenase AlkB-like domain-containing protein n=1 Tax=Chromera velia CCMP2878 TaxID=1169474 RepID=A0A0K6SB14_9ALVE|eukprot:Cvel_12157.t1-p1 / transcript=Cvel_12157.t1 / gene=Cvel_12157 / organism=Chromera_velia_CCMP2878 / gene_product=Alpha-ketoglutarate-dependent dioxygenase alkB, putative / transcript_product=Alpha-ketoglutarate-dependent dioxygenase alkB, putative / location=Cvel_scaffold784:28633-29574(-) / protein_length=314 / sequence_SO=supercontig / SO=protein_coding / is_pseudo=false